MANKEGKKIKISARCPTIHETLPLTSHMLIIIVLYGCTSLEFVQQLIVMTRETLVHSISVFEHPTGNVDRKYQLIKS